MNDEVFFHPKTECCSYVADSDRPYPVFWNRFNRVVQCHNCGHVYSPKQYGKYRLIEFDVPNDIWILQRHLFLCFWKNIGTGNKEKLNDMIKTLS